MSKINIVMYCPDAEAAVKAIEDGEADVAATLPDAAGAVCIAFVNDEVEKEVIRHIYARINKKADGLIGYGSVKVVQYFYPLNFADFNIVTGKMHEWSVHLWSGCEIDVYNVAFREDAVYLRLLDDGTVAETLAGVYCVLDEVGLMCHGAQLILPENNPSSFARGKGFIETPVAVAVAKGLGRKTEVFGRLSEGYGRKVKVS